MLIDNFYTLCAGEEIFQTIPKWGYGENAKRKNKQTDKQKRTNNPKDMQIWPENNSKHLVPLPTLQVT